MDKMKFLQACDKIVDVKRERTGIGTLGEKTLHAVLKNYFEPQEISQEVKIANFVADIVNENGIIEIQTQSFDKLRKKLLAFLQVCRVTVVYPIAKNKWIYWVDEQTGEISRKHKSPKTGNPYEALYELYKISNLLSHENLTICIILLDMEEYKSLDGYGKNKKIRASKIDRIPIDISEEIYLFDVADYKKLLPTNLPQQFTTSDIRRITKLSPRVVGTGVTLLRQMGVITQVGKVKNAFLYEISVQS